jgi:aminoglycoside 3'-phosphotransferase-2
MAPDTPFPDPITRELRGYRLQEIVRRQRVSDVAIASRPGRRSLVLKIGRDLAPEMRRLAWLRGRLPVPEVVAFAGDGGSDFLLMTKLPGRDGSDARTYRDGARFIALLAGALRTVHAVPVDGCPFAAPVDDLLAIAEQRVNDGTLTADDFDARYLWRSPREMLRLLHDLRPGAEGAAFTHGDASLPNVLFHRGAVSGFIDLGLAGVADPWRDLALAARSLTRNMGGRWVRPFLEAYGAPLDEPRIEFFILLDEFTGALPA